MFNKQPKNITNHYHNVFRSTIEIDYEKLAKAMVKAQQEAEEQKEIERQQEENKTKKLSVCETLKIIWLIIVNKAESNGNMTAIFLGGILSLFFNLIALFGVGISILGIVASVIVIKEFTWSLETMPDNVISITLCVCFELFIAVIAFVFRCIANEIEKEKDRNYVIAVFSAVVAFAALVVSVVDAFKEVV